jgi:hypothetical protein
VCRRSLQYTKNERIGGDGPIAPTINHLLFAYDIILFFKAIKNNAGAVQDGISMYCEASGQKVNLAKSSIFFSKGCKQRKKVAS